MPSRENIDFYLLSQERDSLMGSVTELGREIDSMWERLETMRSSLETIVEDDTKDITEVTDGTEDILQGRIEVAEWGLELIEKMELERDR